MRVGEREKSGKRGSSLPGIKHGRQQKTYVLGRKEKSLPFDPLVDLSYDYLVLIINRRERDEKRKIGRTTYTDTHTCCKKK